MGYTIMKLKRGPLSTDGISILSPMGEVHTFNTQDSAVQWLHRQSNFQLCNQTEIKHLLSVLLKTAYGWQGFKISKCKEPEALTV